MPKFYHKSNPIVPPPVPIEAPKKVGITINPKIGIGDALQFASLPENYFFHKKEKLYDISKPWFFDYNPYVVRDRSDEVDKTVEMWNFPTQFPWPNPRKEDKPKIYLSNAEIWASVFDCPVVLNRPRLYHYEDFPFEKRRMIILQTVGQSHGEMPDHIIKHVIEKYGNTNCLFHIGPQKKDYGLHHIETPTLWILAELISTARMFIGMDSGPSWISTCYRDVITKIVRLKPNPPELFKEWIPLEQRNIHSHWDSRERITYNPTDQDIGFTQSYRQI